MIASCYKSPDAMGIIAEELSLVNFASFLTESTKNYSKQEDTLKNDPIKANHLRAERWLLNHRFPVSTFKKYLK